MRAGLRYLVSGIAAISLSACATLPQREATAFKAIAKTDSEAFGKGTAAELASLTEAAIIQRSATGIGIEPTNCTAEVRAGAICEVRLTGTAAPQLALVEGAPPDAEANRGDRQLWGGDG